MDVLTVEQVKKALMVDDDFDSNELSRLASLASIFIYQKTGYDFAKDSVIHPLAIQCGTLYVKQQYYNGAGDYDRNHDYTIGISSLIIDLQCIANSKKFASKVDLLISKISNPVTLSSEQSIVLARASYNALFDSEKEYVTKYSALTIAEAQLEALIT